MTSRPARETAGRAGDGRRGAPLGNRTYAASPRQPAQNIRRSQVCERASAGTSEFVICACGPGDGARIRRGRPVAGHACRDAGRSGPPAPRTGKPIRRVAAVPAAAGQPARRQPPWPRAADPPAPRGSPGPPSRQQARRTRSVASAGTPGGRRPHLPSALAGGPGKSILAPRPDPVHPSLPWIGLDLYRAGISTNSARGPETTGTNLY